MKTKDLKAYRKAYYLRNREIILNRSKARYKHKRKNICKGCGVDITELKKDNNGNLMYCNKCIADKTKVSRQARWYRKNRFRLQYKRKMERKLKKEGLK